MDFLVGLLAFVVPMLLGSELAIRAVGRHSSSLSALAGLPAGAMLLYAGLDHADPWTSALLTFAAGLAYGISNRRLYGRRSGQGVRSASTPS